MLSGNESNTPVPQDYGLMYTKMSENLFHRLIQHPGPVISNDYLIVIDSCLIPCSSIYTFIIQLIFNNIFTQISISSRLC